MSAAFLVPRLAAALPAWVMFAAGPALALHWAGPTLGLSGTALLPALGIAIVVGLLAPPAAARGLAITGLFLLATMLLLPANWTPLESDTALSPGWAAILGEAALILCGIAAWRLAPGETILRAAAVATLAIAALAFASVALPLARTSPPMPKPAIERPNIYQFVFDGFSAPAFDPANAAPLPGFIVYPENRANYFATDASLPSMFTGRFFGGGSFRQFQTNARRSGYRAALAQAGYRVSLYTPDRNRFWWFDHSDRAVTNQEMSRRRADPSGTRTLLQIGLVAAAPIGLRQPLLKLSRVVLPWSRYNIYKQDIRLLDRFLADERSRSATGEYVYFHIMLPHPPYTRDAQCRPSRRTGYKLQLICAERMMQRIVATLDRMDRLEGSLVIFQGDHGFHAKESDLTDIREPMPRAVRARLSELRDSYDPDAMLQRSHALLLVHQPGASGPLRVDMRRSQLVDIAPTVAKVAGLKPWRGVGISLFRPDDPERPWHFFAGITRKHGLFRKRLGRDTDQGRIAHISVDGRGGWIVHPDIVAAGPGRIPGR